MSEFTVPEHEVYKKRVSCGVCGNFQLDTIMNFESVPLAGNFPTKEELGNEDTFPLSIVFCRGCGLLQTDSIIHPDVLFRDYRYMSSVGLTRHFTEVAELLKERFNLDGDSRVLEIGSNDGVLQKPFHDLGVSVVGIEPAVNISKIAKSKGLTVINDYFNREKAEEHFEPKQADLIISNNCFAHIEDINSIVEGIKYVLKPEGHFVLEVHYIKKLIEGIQFDNVYHEHIYYYSVTALNNLFQRHGMTVVGVEEIPVHSGSIRVTVKNSSIGGNIDTLKFLVNESRRGLDNIDFYRQFAHASTEKMRVLGREMTRFQQEKKKVVGYGASGRANMLCNLAHLDPNLVEYIVDESPERAGRYIAGKHIPIVNKEHLDNDEKQPKYVLIFAWNFAKMIAAKLQDRGYKFIIPLPDYRIFEKPEEIDDLGTL